MIIGAQKVAIEALKGLFIQSIKKVTKATLKKIINIYRLTFPRFFKITKKGNLLTKDNQDTTCIIAFYVEFRHYIKNGIPPKWIYGNSPRKKDLWSRIKIDTS